MSEGKKAQYVIQHHWASEPTKDLIEHWDFRIENEQGYIYHWQIFDDPFENADDLLGIQCECRDPEILAVKGRLELKPRSKWNPSRKTAYLETLQSGEFQIVQEEPGRLVGYFGQLPFSAVQEGDSERWDITLGVWVALARKERMAELIKVSVANYDPAELSDAVLGDDFRIAAAWYATLKAGKKIDKTEEEICGYMKKIVGELVKRDKVTFHAEAMKPTSRELLAETLKDLYQAGIYLVSPHGELIAQGKKTAIVKSRKFEVPVFHVLVSGKLAYGMVRFEEPEEIDLETFKERRDEHRISDEECEAWWPGKETLWLYQVRDLAPFEKPISVKVPSDVQTFIKDVKLSAFDMVKLQEFPEDVKAQGIKGLEDIVPEKLKELTKTQLVLLDAYLHGQFEAAKKRTGIELEDIINSALFVAEEKDLRDMERRVESDLDFAVDRLLRGGLAMPDDEEYAELRTTVEHAKDELERAGLFDKDSDYGGMLAKAVMAIMKVFSKQGHSGFSAGMCRELFHKLSNFETLTPITNDPDEWQDISEMCSGKPMWQNKRDPRMFSEDGGKTWYNVEELEETKLHDIKTGSLVYLNDVMPYLKKFDLSKPHVCLVGSLAINGRGHDIDLLVKGGPNRVLEFRIRQMLPPKLRDRVRFINDPEGPFTSYLPLYSLTAERMDTGLVSMSAELQRAAGQDIEREGERAKEKDRIVFGEFFKPMKPLRGAYGEERQTVENFMKLFDDEKHFPRWVSKKFDGMNVQVHAEPDDIWIVSEDGEQYGAGSLPSLEAAFKKLMKDNRKKKAIFLAELEAWEGKSHLPRERIAGIVHSEEHDDSTAVANVYSIVYLDGEDLHGKTETERREALESLKWPQSTGSIPDVGKKLNLVPEVMVENKKELEDVTRRLSNLPASEGVVTKQADSKYRLTGESIARDWVKYHLTGSAIVRVVERETTKAKGAPYKYVYGLTYDPNKWKPNREAIEGVSADDPVWDDLIVLGRSFNWDKKLEKGATFEIEYETLNVTRRADGTVDASFWVPRPMRVVDAKTDSIDDAIRVAAKQGILQRKRITEEDETVYLSDKEIMVALLLEGKVTIAEENRHVWEDCFTELNELAYDLACEFGGERVGVDSLELQRLVKQPPMPEEAQKDIDKWKRLPRTDLAKIDPKRLPQWFWVLESHFRGRSEHEDFRVKQNDHLEGWTIAGQVKGAMPDVDTLTDAKALVDRFDDPAKFKFRPSMDPAKVKVFATRKESQPLIWLTAVNRVVPPGTVGATKEEIGVFYGKDWGILWPGTKKPWFEEYFIYGKRFEGRLVFRLVELEERGRALEPGLNFLTWMAKDVHPYIMTRRARVEKREDVPPDGISWLPPNWEAAVPTEMRWWEGKLTKGQKLDRMDKAYDHFIETGVLSGRKLAKLAKVDFALTVHRWKGPTVVRGISNRRYLLHWDGKTWELQDDPLREEVVVASEVKMKVKPPKNDWLTFEGEIPGGYMKPVTPEGPYPKKLPVLVGILDSGPANLIESTPEFVHVDFGGDELKGRWTFKAEEPGENIFRFGKSAEIGEPKEKG